MGQLRAPTSTAHISIKFLKLSSCIPVICVTLTSSNRILRSHTVCFLFFCPAVKLNKSEFPSHRKSARAVINDTARMMDTNLLAILSTGCSPMDPLESNLSVGLLSRYKS